MIVHIGDRAVLDGTGLGEAGATIPAPPPADGRDAAVLPRPAHLEAVVVPGTSPRTECTAVVAAIDDDENVREVIAYARAWSDRLKVPLRIVHVWTERETGTGVRLPRHDRAADADRFLSTVVDDILPAAEAGSVERQILHDPDPARALVALSHEATMLVVGANSGSAAANQPGDTVRRLTGHTECPLAILPVIRESPTRPEPLVPEEHDLML